MNGMDSSTAAGRGPRIGRPNLPAIVSLEIRRVPFRAPSYRFVRSVLADAKEALAFDVELAGELPLDRDATPVLYVGAVELSHVESLGRRRYRFLALAREEASLRQGAPISLGWPGHKPHLETKFQFAGGTY